MRLYDSDIQTHVLFGGKGIFCAGKVSDWKYEDSRGYVSDGEAGDFNGCC